MLKHLLQIIILAVAVLLGMFLPFMPGQHDPAAILISSTAQAIGFAGILLTPIGIVWLSFGQRSRPLRIAMAAAASIIITFAFVFGAIGNNSLHLAFGILILGIHLTIRFVGTMRRDQTDVPPLDAAPIYLIVIPVVVLVTRFAFIGSAVEFSRNRVIENSRPLIADIEAFSTRNGHYPESLHSEWEDYKPGIVGVGRYHYEPKGQAYSLFFEQYSDQIGLREFVMYNPLGEHQISAHNSDRLLYTIPEQSRMWGWHVVVPLPQENWKYFHFD